MLVDRVVDGDRDHRVGSVGEHVVALVLDIGQQPELVSEGEQILRGSLGDRALLQVREERAGEDGRDGPSRDRTTITRHQQVRRLGERRLGHHEAALDTDLDHDVVGTGGVPVTVGGRLGVGNVGGGTGRPVARGWFGGRIGCGRHDVVIPTRPQRGDEQG